MFNIMIIRPEYFETGHSEKENCLGFFYNNRVDYFLNSYESNDKSYTNSHVQPWNTFWTYYITEKLKIYKY